MKSKKYKSGAVKFLFRISQRRFLLLQRNIGLCNHINNTLAIHVGTVSRCVNTDLTGSDSLEGDKVIVSDLNGFGDLQKIGVSGGELRRTTAGNSKLEGVCCADTQIKR